MKYWYTFHVKNLKISYNDQYVIFPNLFINVKQYHNEFVENGLWKHTLMSFSF